MQIPHFAIPGGSKRWLATLAVAGFVLTGLALAQAPSARAQQRPGRNHGTNLVATVKAGTNAWTRILTVQNMGDGEVAEFDVSIRTPAGSTLFSGHSTALLGVPESQSTNFTVNIGAFPCGTALVFVDGADAVGHVDPSGAILGFSVCPKLDLAVTASPGGGGSSVSFTISNVGTGNAGRFVVQATGDMGFSQSVTVNSLAAGDSQKFTLSGRATGETVRIVADPSNVTFDYNQVNNLGVSKP